MRLRNSSARPAWTLLEILVVLAIIGVLASLTFLGFSAAYKTVERIEADVQAAIRPSDTVHLPTLTSVRAAMPARQAPKAPEIIPNRYAVLLDNSNHLAADAQKLAQKYGGTVLSILNLGTVRGFTLKLDDNLVAGLKQEPGVRVVPDQRAHASAQTTPTGDRRLFTMTHKPTNGSFYKKPLSTTTASVVVAVLDTGVDSTHSELNVVFSKGFGSANPNGEDQDGHGTHVAGIIGARNNTAGVVGVYPGAPIWSLRVLDATGTGSNLDILDALQLVHDNADTVRVANLSLGSGFDATVNAAVDACANKGVLMVVAAGNSTANSDNYSPASAAQAICVAALADSDGKPGGLGAATSAGPDDTFADFSNYGASVDVIAPGTDINSCAIGGGYTVKSGTSMAAPHIAGLLALMLDPNTRLGTVRRNLLLSLRPVGTASAINILTNTSSETITGPDNRKYPLPNFFAN
jgi:subtilisin